MKRWLFLTSTTAALALLVMILISLALAQRARHEAERYLRAVTPLRIGTSYDVALGELSKAGISMKQLNDCRQECALVFDVSDKWLYLLHLAAPAEFIGRLDFNNQQLIYKETAMGRGMCCFAIVNESRTTISKVSSRDLDASGHPSKINVDLAATDFTNFREMAYAYKVACIGSRRACWTDEYLPWSGLEKAIPK